MVFLDANENPYESGVNRYPDPYQRSVKEVLADIKGAPGDHLLLGNGSDEVLDLLFRAFCEPGVDHIITLPPTYGMYRVLAGINNVGVTEITLTADFKPQVSNILEAQNPQSKLLFLCSPNNPTANNFDTKAMHALLAGFKGIVVVDEAYIDFSDQESWVSQLHKYPNLVVTQTLSKAYGMAGIRLGLCWASPKIIAILNKIKPPYNVNQLTQIKALERLQDRAGVAQEIQNILSERNVIAKELGAIPFVTEVFPSDANFVLARVDDANLRYDQLLAAGIVIRNRTTQALCENTLRFTVGTPEENRKLITALKSIA
jgi:histidinol-phosphate aminotransferase